MNTPLISICIPTYNRQDILRNTIASIYADLNEADIIDFEVIVSDNSSESTCKDVISEFHYNNLYYYHTDCVGFLNSYYSLCYGNGKYLKLHNNYTMLRKGSLRKLISLINQNVDNQKEIIFTNGLLNKGKLLNYSSFDEFMYSLSYFSSWSSGFGIWKSEFDKIKNLEKPDKMFPQTTFLLTMTGSCGYLIQDCIWFDDQFVPKKGGYNIFKVFSNDFYNLIEGAYLKNDITKRTFKHITKQLLYNYLSVRYFKTVIATIDNFEATKIKESITQKYSVYQYYLMIILAYLSPFIIGYRKIKNISNKLTKIS